MVKSVVMKGLTMSHRELDQSGSTKNFYIANKWYVQDTKYPRLFWLPKSGGVGFMLENQALFQWYQQAKELHVERNDGTYMLEIG